MRAFDKSLESAEGLPEVFEIVKRVVMDHLGKSRAGLNLALADLGSYEGGFIGAFYPVGSNTIVMNKAPLRSIYEQKPEWLNPYAFHILLHEYLHTLGYLDENLARKTAHQVSTKALGEGHIATLFAADLSKFLPYILYPPRDWTPETPQLEYVKDFDYSSVNYIG